MLLPPVQKQQALQLVKLWPMLGKHLRRLLRWQ
jgi:hypothetical protein